MKKTLLLIFVLLSFKSYAQQNTYTKVFLDSMSSGIEARAMVRTPDKGFMIAGQSNYSFGYLQKLDSAGDLVWDKLFGGLQFNSICNTSDSCFVIAGLSQGSAVPVGVFCGKVNAMGDTLWMNQLDFGSNYAFAVSLSETVDSGFIITGSISYNTLPNRKIFVSKLSSAGNLEWSNLYTVSGYANDGVTIKQDADSNYILLGNFENMNPVYQRGTCLIKLSPTGNVVWAKKYLQAEAGNDFVFTDSSIVVSLNSGSYNALMKTDLAGNVLWSNGYGDASGNYQNYLFPKIKIASDSSFIILAGDAFGGELIKTDTAGTLIWSNALEIIPVDIMEVENKQLFILGNGPLWAVKGIQILIPQIGTILTDSMGTSQNCIWQNLFIPQALSINDANLTVTTLSGGILSSFQTASSTLSLVVYSGCVDHASGIEENYKSQISIAPNPSTGIFSVTTNEKSPSVFTVYDMMGNEMFSSAINDDKTTVDFSHYSKGIYYCRIVSKKNKVAVGKIVVVE